VLAHEIRNPLAALRFQLHSLRKNSADAGRVAGTADTIDGELLRIQQLVTDYLEHEKARSMRVQRVDLAQSAASLQTLMLELFKQSRTEFVVVPPPSPVLVTCDPHGLRQVLMNLVLNAQQAMGDGGRVTLRIGREENFGTIDVSDTGPGIPPEVREQLFKPFATTKREGHGIGLALVKRFVDNFGGGVSVQSESGRGTTFHLRLPLAGVEEGGTWARQEQGSGFPVILNAEKAPAAEAGSERT
jgi:signal transduction histidine kinase